jgi:hypothetical protein
MGRGAVLLKRNTRLDVWDEGTQCFYVCVSCDGPSIQHMKVPETNADNSPHMNTRCPANLLPHSWLLTCQNPLFPLRIVRVKQFFVTEQQFSTIPDESTGELHPRELLLRAEALGQRPGQVACTQLPKIAPHLTRAYPEAGFGQILSDLPRTVALWDTPDVFFGQKAANAALTMTNFRRLLSIGWRGGGRAWCGL